MSTSRYTRTSRVPWQKSQEHPGYPGSTRVDLVPRCNRMSTLSATVSGRFVVSLVLEHHAFWERTLLGRLPRRLRLLPRAGMGSGSSGSRVVSRLGAALWTLQWQTTACAARLGLGAQLVRPVPWGTPALTGPRPRPCGDTELGSAVWQLA